MDLQVEQALLNHHKGYNCAQAVACAFAETAGMDEQMVFKLMEGFGLGMGNMQDVCGAVSGAVALAGIVSSDGNMEAPHTKKGTYALARQIKQEFMDKNHAVCCCKLKGLDTGSPLRDCDGCIRDAAEIADKILFHT